PRRPDGSPRFAHRRRARRVPGDVPAGVTMSVLREYAASVVEHGSAQDPAYDEIVDAEGTLRPAWRRLLAEAGDLSTERLAGVRAEIERLLADEGAVYTPPGEEPRAWRLDPLPLVLSG